MYWLGVRFDDAEVYNHRQRSIDGEVKIATGNRAGVHGAWNWVMSALEERQMTKARSVSKHRDDGNLQP